MRSPDIFFPMTVLAVLAAAVPGPMGEVALLHSQSHLGFGGLSEKLHASFKAPHSPSQPVGEKKPDARAAARTGPKSSILSEVSPVFPSAVAWPARA